MSQSPVKMMLGAAFGRQPPNGAGGTDTAALHAIAEAAVTWWMERWRGGWSLAQQLADPVVNCEGDHERRLADAASKWVSLKT
jgi:hypothetical protein